MAISKRFTLLLCLCLLVCLIPGYALLQAQDGEPLIHLPRSGISKDEIAVIVNDDDPASVETADYYRKIRQLEPEQLIHVRFAAGRKHLDREEFETLRQEIAKKTPEHIQAYAVAWTQPYRVDCMSLTSALSLGFDEKYCSSRCATTAASPYFNSISTRPWDDFKLRPSMMLAGSSLDQVKKLIDRGLTAERQTPSGRAYLLETSDVQRSVRSRQFPDIERDLSGVFPIEQLKADSIEDKTDVLFYFTGRAHVGKLNTLRFVPGALADHLTSFGGDLLGKGQMSILRWLDAGATASYGTVVEPCNHPEKFPMPGIAMTAYAQGATAVEAYWKSVAWPGEGVFVGDPLARPFAPRLRLNGEHIEIRALSTRHTLWSVETAPGLMGPYQALPMIHRQQRGWGIIAFDLPTPLNSVYRIIRR